METAEFTGVLPTLIAEARMAFQGVWGKISVAPEGRPSIEKEIC